MRCALIALAAASTFVCAPALAAEGDAAHIAEKLSDPAMQAEIARMAETMTAVMLDMNIGPMARAAAEIEGKDPEAVDPTSRCATLPARKPRTRRMKSPFACRR